MSINVRQVNRIWIVAVVAILLTTALVSSQEPIMLRLEVTLTPEELVDFEPALQAIDEAHPEWNVELINISQDDFRERVIEGEAVNETLGDVLRVSGVSAQQLIRSGVIHEIDSFIEGANFDLDDFYGGALDQFIWEEMLWGLPDSASPDVVFYNIDMFDAAGLAYPDDTWTYDDMREAALLLTLDANGNNATSPDFDPDSVVQWGWGTTPDSIFKRHMIQAFGADFCANDDCTQFDTSSPEIAAALEWWASFAHDENAALHDPYGGSQTGEVGHPFHSGHVAMAFNGFFGIGQLNLVDEINYDITEPFIGADGARHTPLSTNGYLIAANTEHPEAAWELVQALTSPEFLSDTWASPGHSIPARRSVAEAAIHPENPPEHQPTILAAMEYGEVFRPFTSNAFPAYGATLEYFAMALRGKMEVAEALVEIERIANEVLAPDHEE